MSYCAKCGAPLPPGSQFCPRCGTPLNVPPPPTPDVAATPPPPRIPQPQAAPPQTAQPHVAPTHVPPPPRARSALWIVPLVLLGLGGLAWLLLAGLPFGGRDAEPEAPRVETIAEGTVPPASARDTATLISGPGEDVPVVITEEMPPNTTTAPPTTATATTTTTTTTTAPPPVRETPPPVRATPPPVRTTPPPVRTTTPPVRTVPPPVREAPPPVRTTRPPVRETPPPIRDTPPPARVVPAPARADEISENEGAGILRSYIGSRNYYDVGSDCLRISSRGYRNRGYAYEVWQSCGRGPSRLLGRWRVDSLTREVFRQREDGRYLRP